MVYTSIGLLATTVFTSNVLVPLVAISTTKQSQLDLDILLDFGDSKSRNVLALQADAEDAGGVGDAILSEACARHRVERASTYPRSGPRSLPGVGRGKK